MAARKRPDRTATNKESLLDGARKQLETTRRYSLPSDTDRLLAIERLQIDY